jgi:hypothetical protein
VRNRRGDEEEEPFQVDVDDPVPVGLARLVGGPLRPDSGRADDSIEATAR